MFLLEYLLLMYVKICKQLSSFVGFLFVTLLKNYTYKVGWGGGDEGVEILVK